MILPALAAAAVAAGAVLVLLLRWGVWRWLAGLAAACATVSVLVVPSADRAPAAAALLATSAGVLLLGWRAGTPLLRTAAGLTLPVLGLLAAVGAGLGDRVGASADVSAGVPGAVAAGLGVCLGLALLAVAGAGRARGSGLRTISAATALVPTLVGLASVALGAGASSAWPVLVWLPASGALGVSALLRGHRAPAAGLPQHDDVDLEAVRDFDERYDTPRVAPVVVVVAAYDEGRGIGDVLDQLPTSVCDLPVDVVVVDDGSADDTAEQVRAADRGLLVTCGRNRGQGAALRLGYRVAREHGADYLITTDADGQYDPDDFPSLLAPLLAGQADFVTGSRLLGRQQTRDRVRRAGVHVFAWLVSALVGRRVTDTSFGLRAMRAEVTAAVTLNQPQYQSSELLIGVLSHGFRVLEVPGTMRVRSAGSSKKGSNWRYGRSYAMVVLGTWWREGCPAPVRERAAALRGGEPVAPG